LIRFIDTMVATLKAIAEHTDGGLQSPEFGKAVFRIDPQVLTGCAALTASVQSWLKDAAALRWDALTGLHDGGRNKLVDDVLVLAITGFRYGHSFIHIPQTHFNEFWRPNGKEG